MLIKLGVMKKQISSYLSYILIILVFIFWPTSLYLANSKVDFLRYIIPSVFIIISFFLFKKKKKYYLIPLFLIPFFEPKLSVLPLLAVFTDFIFDKKLIKLIFGITISLVILLFNFQEFKGETVFQKDYEAQQLVIRNIHLYPKPLIARIYQNKGRIIVDKFNDNFFALTDLNNYFFAFHPREITVKNQNLAKFPFLAIFLFIFGLVEIIKTKSTKYLSVIFISLIFSLSILTNFDRQDFILWFPIGLIILNGINFIKNNFQKSYKYIFLVSILVSLWELIRTVISYKLI